MGVTTSQAINAYPELKGLARLRERGWRFLHLDDEHGEPTGIIGTRERSGCTEVLWILGPEETRAVRMLGRGTGDRGDLVWKVEGPLAQTVPALLELPAPGEPGAPELVIGRGLPTDW